MTPVPRFNYGKLYFDVPKSNYGVPEAIADERFLCNAAQLVRVVALVFERNLK